MLTKKNKYIPNRILCAFKELSTTALRTTISLAKEVAAKKLYLPCNGLKTRAVVHIRSYSGSYFPTFGPGKCGPE